MTLKEKVAMEEPGVVRSDLIGGCWGCPYDYSYLPANLSFCEPGKCDASKSKCTECWNQEMPGTEHIKYAKEEAHCHTKTIDFEIAYNDLKVDYEKLMKEYEDLNTTVMHQKSHMQRLQDEITFLRACVMRAVGGKPAEMCKERNEEDDRCKY